MKEKRSSRLYIPTKILDSDDYIQGFGRTELAVVGLITVAAVIIGVIIYQIDQNTVPAVMSAFAIVGTAVFLVRRDMCNENVFQKLHIIWKNNTAQKRYFYRYHNIYEDVKEDARNEAKRE